MFVPSYQMHNVLNVYSNKLRRNTMMGKNEEISAKPSADRVSLNSEGKRRTTVEKISKDILNKITRFSAQSGSTRPISDRTEEISERQVESDKSDVMERTAFVFNVINTINKKTTNTVSADDSNFLIQRLDQMSKDMQTKKEGRGFEDPGNIDGPEF